MRNLPQAPCSQRRLLLKLAISAPVLALLGPLAGCSPKPEFRSTFLQLWKSHLDLPPEAWHQRMAFLKEVGCSELVLQWVGQTGSGVEGGDWMLPDASMRTLLDACAEYGLHVRIGLPYDNGWWAAMASGDEQALPTWFNNSLQAASAYMRDSQWPMHPQFSGWYIPYEIEQYSWVSPARQELLGNWLTALSQVSQKACQGVPSISTYFSVLETEGSLLQLWHSLLKRTKLRVMVQDGVGVAGWDNLDGVDPLIAYLREQHVPFDVIVELFEQLPSERTKFTEFTARSADYSRVKRQFAWAKDTGAQSIVAFAIEPWVTADDEYAKALKDKLLNGWF